MKPVGKDWAFRDYTLRSGICFFILFALFGGSGSVLALLPLIGSSLDSNVRRPMDLLVQWVGIHAFHLTGVAATFHVLSGSDSEMQWIAIPVMFAIALVAALIWRVFDRRNAHDLLGWLRLIVRLTLGVAMLRYGFIKVFPIQFPSPPLAVLNEQVGNASPTMLFWSLYGIRPHFVMLLGWIEVVAGLALFFSRTAFFGSVLTFLVMTNVALLDVTFDVPVKLYSLSLLVMSFVLLLPEIQGLRLFFFTGKTATRNDVWSPRISPAGRNLLLGLEFLMVLLACGQFASGTHAVWKMKRQSVAHRIDCEYGLVFSCASLQRLHSRWRQSSRGPGHNAGSLVARRS